MTAPPKSILIVGSGVFGLSTSYALAQRPAYSSTPITVLDRSPFPSQDGSSIDSSRIIRADYSDPAYAALASAAQQEWRKQGPDDLGGEGRYTESGLVLVSEKGVQGEHYVRESLVNVQQLMNDSGDSSAIQELPSRSAIKAEARTGGGSGAFGYVNRRSGWADAEASMVWLRKQVEQTGRVKFVHAEVQSLIRDEGFKRVLGVKLKDGSETRAELTVRRIRIS